MGAITSPISEGSYSKSASCTITMSPRVLASQFFGDLARGIIGTIVNDHHFEKVRNLQDSLHHGLEGSLLVIGRHHDGQTFRLLHRDPSDARPVYTSVRRRNSRHAED